MTRIYLIRHGETDWNRDEICMGQMDVPLNEQGRRQALLTAEHLASERIDAIYTSDLSRALETARPIAECHGLNPITRRDLRELDYGRWQGLRSEEIRRRFPQAFTIGAEGEDSLGFQPEGGESRLQLYKRVTQAFEEILQGHPNETVVIATHGGVIRCLVNYVLQRGSNHQNKGIFYSLGFACDNCAITTIEARDDGRLWIVSLNDTSHLEQSASSE